MVDTEWMESRWIWGFRAFHTSMPPGLHAPLEPPKQTTPDHKRPPPNSVEACPACCPCLRAETRTVQDLPHSETSLCQRPALDCSVIDLQPIPTEGQPLALPADAPGLIFTGRCLKPIQTPAPP